MWLFSATGYRARATLATRQAGTTRSRRTPSTSDENFWPLSRAGAHDGAHGRHVGRVQRPAERVGQQLLGGHGQERIGPRRAPPAAGPRRPWSGVPSASWPGRVDRHARVALAPGADEVEVLERKPDRVHDLVARGTHRVGAVQLEPLAQRGRLGRLDRSSRFTSTPGGGCGGGVPSRFSSTHLPRDTGEVRVATDVTVSMLPWPSRPRRGLSAGERHAAEVAAVHVGNAVVPRQPFVQRTCSRRRAASTRLRSSRTMLPKSISVSRRNDCRRLSSNVPRLRLHVGELAQVEPLARRSCRTSASAFGSASMRDTCCSSTAGSTAGPATARSSSWSSGMLLHRKNESREASARSLIGVGAALGGDGRALPRCGTRTWAPRGCARAPAGGPVSKSAPSRPCRGRTSSASRSSAAVGGCRKARRASADTIRRAHGVSWAAGRAADEDLLLARRVAGAGGVERARDGQRRAHRRAS